MNLLNGKTTNFSIKETKTNLKKATEKANKEIQDKPSGMLKKSRNRKLQRVGLNEE
jgi:hypothetical protein